MATAADVARRNAEFSDELRGSHMALRLGIRGASPEELARLVGLLPVPARLTSRWQIE